MNERYGALGTHLLVELNDCNPSLLDDMLLVQRVLLRAAEEAGATIVGEVFHKFSPIGVTGIVCIAESHISIHTWPEHAYAAVDIFTCGEDFKPRKAANFIAECLQSRQCDITEVQRGAVSASLSAAFGD
ncbi:MAG: adenosylmethionine decarboxylase [Chloroflexi bacterium]|nr:adenosylmethionine decarboxylase [Chloroflexota bacterium]